MGYTYAPLKMIKGEFLQMSIDTVANGRDSTWVINVEDARLFADDQDEGICIEEKWVSQEAIEQMERYYAQFTGSTY